MKCAGCRVTGNKQFQEQILPYGSRLLVGVSGGADSMALLNLLVMLRHQKGLDLVVAHYDHALRRGSSKDLHFVADEAGKLGLKFVSERNTSVCPKSTSIEDFARQKRFDFFRRAAKKNRADGIVLAHTQDDLAETVMMRLLRGSGLSGLRSILPVRNIGGVTVFRPMLKMSRVDVDKVLAAGGIKHVEDPTNKGDDFLRNRIRHKLIPFMAREFSGAVKEKLAQMASAAALDHDFMQRELERILPRVLWMDRKKARIKAKVWQRLHQALQRMVLKEVLTGLGKKAALSYEHILELERVIRDRKKGRFSAASMIFVDKSDEFITLS